MTLDSKSVTFSVLARVTPTTDKATIDTYRDGLVAAGITIPADANQISVREDEVAAGATVNIALDNFTDAAAPTTLHYDSDGNATSFKRIDALAILAVSQTDSASGEQFRVKTTIDGFISGASTYAYGTITNNGTAVLTDTLTINAEVWTVANVTAAARAAYQIPVGTLTDAALASYINADSTGYTAEVTGVGEVTVTSTDIYQVGTTIAFSETGGSSPTFTLDGAGFLTGSGPTSLSDVVNYLEEVNDFHLLGWSNGMFMDETPGLTSVAVAESLSETAVQFKVVAIGLRA